MNKCKNCEFWKQTSEKFGVGYCSKLRGDAGDIKGQRFVRVFCPSYCGGDGLHTYADFGCVHFEEKQPESGPFCVAKSDSEIHVTESWYLTFGKDVSPTLFRNADVAEMWREWLNELWAQEKKNVQTCDNCAFICAPYNQRLPCMAWSSKE